MNISVFALRACKLCEVFEVLYDGTVAELPDYKVEIPDRALAFNHIVLFDGLLLEQALPNSSRILPYKKYGSNFSTETDLEPVCMVAPLGQLKEGAESDPHIHMHTPSDDMAIAVMYRHFILLPKDKRGDVRALGYRYRPRSLKKQYIMMQSFENEVQFITCNSW